MLKRLRFPSVMVVLALVLAPLWASGQELLLISIDGLRPDYILQADAHGMKIPHLRRILRDGAHASGVRGVLPTVTYPSHTTIVVIPTQGGTHGYAPSHPEMLASFFMAGPGVGRDLSLGEIDMRAIAPTVAAYLGFAFPSADGNPLALAGARSPARR